MASRRLQLVPTRMPSMVSSLSRSVAIVVERLQICGGLLSRSCGVMISSPSLFMVLPMRRTLPGTAPSIISIMAIRDLLMEWSVAFESLLDS